jgi:hypothetical protein
VLVRARRPPTRLIAARLAAGALGAFPYGAPARPGSAGRVAVLPYDLTSNAQRPRLAPRRLGTPLQAARARGSRPIPAPGWAERAGTPGPTESGPAGRKPRLAGGAPGNDLQPRGHAPVSTAPAIVVTPAGPVVSYPCGTETPSRRRGLLALAVGNRMPRIQQLPPAVITQIAVGEVARARNGRAPASGRTALSLHRPGVLLGHSDVRGSKQRRRR